MDKLVDVFKGEAVTTSLVIADAVNVHHKNVITLLNTHFDKNDEELAFQTRVLKNPRGEDTRYAILNEDQAMYLITLMRNSVIVKKFKWALVKEFSRMRNHINSRVNGKSIHRQKTDVIKIFVEYATAQGSKSSQMYYCNLAKMENTALFFLDQKYPNVRDVLNTNQLFHVSTADDIINKALMDGMDQELNYKDIYKLAKERILQYADLIGRSPINQLLSNKLLK